MPEFAAPDLNADGLAAKRLPSVGADDQARKQRFSFRTNRNHRLFRAHDIGFIVEPRQVGKRRRARFQRCDQRMVVDVVAECVETDFVARKPYLRCADQAAGVVDQPHRLQWRRLVPAAWPDVEPFQEIDRAAQ